MAGRKVFNEQDARRCIAAASRTTGGVATWAAAHGVDGRSLNAWAVNLKKRGVPLGRRAPSRLVELVPIIPVVSRRSTYVLRVGGVELEVGDDFNEQTLRRLVGVLRGC